MSQNPQDLPITSIKILGKFQATSSDFSSQQKQAKELPLDYQSIKLDSTMGAYCPELASKPQNYVPVPKKIYVEGNLIAFIDQLDNLWFISSIFQNNINVSVMLGRKIRHVSLSQNQCIVNNKRNPILLNWGAKKILDVSNMEIVRINDKVNKNIGSYFTAYSILQASKDDRFMYSNMKKVDNSNKLYQLSSQIQCVKHDLLDKTLSKSKNPSYQKCAPQNHLIHQIIAYPTLQRSTMKNKVLGLSIGKYHCMCWDIYGLLYTWGSRSLALGYEELPHEKITSKPRVVKKMNKFVTMAFAAAHYSLALSSDGNLYEWGIKKLPNELNEQLIFQPKILKVGYKSSKIVMLKGKNEQIACLNSKHELYVWGENVNKILSRSFIKYIKLQKCIVYQPVLISQCHGEEQIVDFGIGDQFIALLTSNSDSMVMGEEQKMYWDDLLHRVKGKLKQARPLKTEKSQMLETYKQKYQVQRLKTMEMTREEVPLLDFCLCVGAGGSVVEKSYQRRNIKREYFKSLKNEKQLYINLLNNSNNSNNIYNFHNEKQMNTRISNISLDTDKQNEIQQKSIQNSQLVELTNKIQIKTNKILQKCNKITNCQHNNNTSFNSTLNQTKLYLNTMYSETLKKISFGRTASIDFQSLRRKSQIKDFKRISISPYHQRLQKVQRKKKSIEDNYLQQISKSIEENSIQHRMLRHNQILTAKTNAKYHQILKNTLQSYLIKHLIIKILITPIEQARNIKIQQFAKNLQLSRIQKNLRKIFVKNRVNSRLKKLKPSTYALLHITFNQYVKRRRQKHLKQKKKVIAQQLYKYVLLQKIKQGLGRVQFSVRKLQKFRQWLVITKNERIKCLKVLWKKYLPQTMRVNHDTDVVIYCKVPDNCTFQSLYKDKISANPMLKLKTFLDKTPIFSSTYQNFQTSYRRDIKSRSQKTLTSKGIRSERRKQRIKFNVNKQGQYLKTLANITCQNTDDFLPYSLHYNLFVRPKSMEVNILQNMKRNEQWIQTQRSIYTKCIKQIIENHEKQFIKSKNRYDIELAYFIKERYDILAERRWKCVVEYNQLQLVSKREKKQKESKEKELFRIFDLIGMERTLKEDCLPEKYLMLEQALKKKDGPQPPNPYIVFGLNEFKTMLKKYYEHISVQAKQMRSKYM